MLGARTKTVASYGRRGHRIIAVSDERRDRDRLAPDDAAISHSVSRSDIGKAKTAYAEPASSSRESTPPSSPEYKPQKLHNVAKDEKASKVKGTGRQHPGRKPLSAVSANLPSAAPIGTSSPLVRKVGTKKPKPRVVSGKTSTPLRGPVSLKPVSPVISVEIIVLDDEGKQVNVENRTTKPAVPVNRVKQNMQPRRPKPEAKRGYTAPQAIELPDDEDSAPVPAPRANKPRKSRKRVVVSSSEDDSDIEIISRPSKLPSPPSVPESPPLRRPPPAKRSNNIVLSSPESVASTSRGAISAKPPTNLQPRAPHSNRSSLVLKSATSQDLPDLENRTKRASIAQPSRRPLEFAPPGRSKPRPLTPIRSRVAFPVPHSPPSPASDSDLEDSLALDLSDLALSPKTLRALTAAPRWDTPTQPAYLRPLLAECKQDAPYEFSAFIELFPHDALVQGGAARPAFRKIGEASYSEVFGIGDVVLKIVPLRDEAGARRDVDDGECPAPSDARDVLKEVIVTRAMGAVCGGFTELLRSYVVRGKYPSLLLDLWDEYHERKGSESVRPDGFTVSQVYAIIVLPNGGPDLESYSFATAAKAGWRQACSLFWQVARALADAEELVAFEHRDLHWGQILVKDISPSVEAPRRGKGKLPMDSDVYGVQATIIDLGLSRMTSGDSGDAVHWTPFDEETFEGEGDYQFDIYRMMRAHIGNSWETFRPLTNVMWLHYLLDKLLRAKRLRKPIAPKKATKEPAPGTFTELECWECLTEVEGVLRDALEDVRRASAPKKGRRKTQAIKAPSAGGPTCAGDVVDLAYERGWLVA